MTPPPGFFDRVKARYEYDLTKNNLPKIDNHLEDRSRLAFYFPDPSQPTPIPIHCPFFENPIISESQEANLVTYDVIGRAGSLFGYTGAKSRKFSVKFFMTLPLMMHLAGERLKSMSQFHGNKDKTTEELQSLFFAEEDEAFGIPTFGTGMTRSMKARSYSDYAAKFVKNLDNGDPVGFEHRINSQQGEGADGTEAPIAVNPTLNSIQDKQLASTIDLMTYWVNLIRSSVLNNAKRPVLGPPVIRLTFGSLYRNVATVASNYKVSYDSAAGFDLASLLPHRVVIELTLHEVRLNSAEGFKPWHAVRSDSLVGWEEVSKTGYISSDPDTSYPSTRTSAGPHSLPPL